MKTRPIILFILLTFTKSSFTQNLDSINTKNKSVTEVTGTYDSTKIAILKYDSTYSWLCKDCLPEELTKEELLKVHTLTEQYVKNYNSDTFDEYEQIGDKQYLYKRKKHTIINLTRYKRQYIATLNTKGEKIIWINCFCNDWKKNWHKELILVHDGGSCYFNLKINLTIEYLDYFRVNGES